ncbi:unnamed protein product [Mycena citricolor]|uniref:DNA-(apurinic or apyrimidinic site) endonuclease n=2 Tax=Mycena citricolor TaxID=2018698 RepID=A0AAD2Q3Y1_9AGAR|nr:unnamed protein product [Mycena citricolor]
MRIITWNIALDRMASAPFQSITHALLLLMHGTEMKSSRSALPKATALPPSYHSFFSFPTHKTGYSGVGVYTRPTPLSADDRLSSTRDVDPTSAPLDVDAQVLDSEGRTLILDFGLFVLVNVYCPSDSASQADPERDAERFRFKMAFHQLLKERVRQLVHLQGREVVVVGDLNACADVIDHAEGALIEARGEGGFWEYEPRKWLRDWLVDSSLAVGGGCLVDVVRKFWPERKAMYTCWNTKMSARASNYGSRIDYILVTPGLLPWIKAADIQPDVKGSDHCPVYIDLHDQITLESGVFVKLADVLGNPEPGAEPPRLAAKFWEEHRQRGVDTFFGKAGAKQVVALKKDSPVAEMKAPSASPPEDTPKRERDILQSSSSSSSCLPIAAKSPSPASTAKRKQNGPTPSSSNSKRPKNGQPTLASFFGSKSASASQSSVTHSSESTIDSDYQLALALSAAESEPSSSPPNPHTARAWTTILAPLEPPRCSVHDEPAKVMTVNKPGPNRGKTFFVCSRPVGPGYDRGRAERLREEVDPRWKCDFFRWAADVRAEMVRKEKDK